jgi:hypothetical protein
MARPQHWARVRPGIECTLRRGAWYPVVELTPTEAVLAVNRQALRIPRASVQILPLRPPFWSLVRRRPDNFRYAVCPRCSRRRPFLDASTKLRCDRCRGLFAVAWSDSQWQALEVLPDRTPAFGILERARMAALHMLATAFGRA